MLYKRCPNRHLLKQLYTSHHRGNRRETQSALTQNPAKLVSLTNRSVIQVNGKDSTKLLQGLITNDLHLLDKENPLIYSMLLNTNGRIVYDLLMYRGAEENEYLIECDDTDHESLTQLLKKYKLRSKVYFEKRTDLNLYCIFDSLGVIEDDKFSNFTGCYRDPRLPQFGFRVLTDCLEQPLIDKLNLDLASLEEYKEHRYRIGISEGTKEVNNGIPLEHNLVFLNGVSFIKGCYIGQELVARTHHVGVIRKRLMPLQFSTEMNDSVCGQVVVNQKGKNSGKIVGCCGKLGVGVMRLREVNSATQLNVSGTAVSVNCHKPDWWPSLD